MPSVDRTLATGALALCLVTSGLARAQEPAVLLSNPDAETVRGLPICTTYMTLPEPGQPYTCRPQWHGTRRGGVTFELGEIELGPAGLEARTPLQHSAFAIGASGTLWLTRELGVKVHYDYVTGGPRETDVDGDLRSDTRRHSLNVSIVTGGLSLRLFTDETNREAWLAEIEGGWLFEHDGLFPDGPVVQLSLGRQVGKTVGLGDYGLDFSLMLVGTQGLAGAIDYRSLSLMFRYGIEIAPREPRDMDRPWTASAGDYVVGGRLDLVGGEIGNGGGVGLASGLALIFGLPVARWVEPRVEVGFTWLGTLADHDVPLSYTTLGGVRLRGANILPVFLQAMAGYAWSFGTLAPNGTGELFGDGAVIDLSAGVYFADCQLGGSFGVRWLAGLEHQNKELDAVILFTELDWGSRSGTLGERRHAHEDGYSCDSPSHGSVPQRRTGN